MSGKVILSKFRKATSRQKRALEEASLAQARLSFIVNAMRQLRSDAHFVTLLRAEGLQTAPKFILDRVDLEPSHEDRL